MRSIILESFEVRAFEERGELLAWCNAEIKDSHGTRIVPDEVLRAIKTCEVRFDSEHDFEAIDGVTLSEAYGAMRPIDDPETRKKIFGSGVGVLVKFDLAVRAAREAWQKWKDGVYRGLSIAFDMPRVLKAKIKAKATDIIDKITELPFISFVKNPSNAASMLLEMRSKKGHDVADDALPDRVADAAKGDSKPAPEQSTKSSTEIDRMELLKRDVEGLAKPDEAVSPSKGDDKPSTSPAPEAGKGADAELATRMKALSDKVDAIEARTQVINGLKETLDTFTKSIDALRHSLSETDKRSKDEVAKVAGDVSVLIETVGKIPAAVRAHVSSVANSLTAPLARRAAPRLPEGADALTELELRKKEEEQAGVKSKARTALDVVVDNVAQLNRF